jgi:hypothetical protein
MTLPFRCERESPDWTGGQPRCDTAVVNENPEVTAFLDALEHPLKDAILAVRSTILEADDRMAESIKWKSPTFVYKGNLASIDPKAKKHVTVLFHSGASIPGDHPLLEGGGDVARYVRFPDVASIERRRDELAAVVRAWCDSRP